MMRIVLLLAAALAAPVLAQTNPHGDDGLDCAGCHDEASWQVGDRLAAFDHTKTGYPLGGRHAGVACRACHRDLVFARVGVACADCHADPHRLRLGTDCAACHTPEGWIDRDDMRRRHDGTSLPLVGAHARVDCEACHRGPIGADFANTPADCYGCHAAVYAATTAPPHAASGFSTDCARCHGVFSATWGSSSFVHSASFPLTGAHRTAPCTACHAGGYTGTPAACVACHQAAYDGTTNPAHAAAGFPTDCAACHTTSAWTPASFDHAATGFPLTGAHATTTCASCHAGGYTGTPAACVACHQAAYDGTTNPAHAAVGFPTDCAACHTTAAWQPSTWSHDALFPIYNGRHRGAWNSCADCHPVPSNYAVFECIFCHEHNRSDTDSHHNEVGGYQYVSTACLQCHPQGGGGDR